MNTKLYLIIILIASLAVHFAYFGQPDEVVFDEVWYGRHVNDYLRGTFHFDGHPPLGRMTVAGLAKFLDYEPISQFANISEKYPDRQYLILRFLPSLAGSLLSPVVFLVMLTIGISAPVAFAGSLLLAFDNGLLVQSRFLLMDAFLLLYGFTSLLFYLKYKKSENKYHLILAGVFSGLAFSTKWVGLSFIALPLLSEGIRALAAMKNEGLRALGSSRMWIALAALTIIPLVLYFCIITAYSSLLHKSGTGDAFMSPEYQKTLQGSRYEKMGEIKPANVFEKFYELNREMYQVNQGLTADHPYASRWYTWPFMKKPIYYWVSGEARIYFMGNPAVWWLSAMAVIYAFWFIMDATWIRLRVGLKSVAIPGMLILLLAGYILNLLPYIGIKRIMFLYHYLSAMVFSVIIFSFLVDKYLFKIKIFKNNSILFLGILIAAGVAMFIYFAPLSYGLPLTTGAYESRVWFESWR